MTPMQVTKENEKEVYNNLYPMVTMDYTRPKYKINDHVLVARTKKTFEKGYTANYHDEVYKIVKVRETLPRVYKLETLDGKTSIFGSFYEQQLVKVDYS
jgi:hypothetical protein